MQSIKNTSCFELLIDRGKAPKKMGTLKDISLYDSFTFPLDGDYAGGLVARSLAGVGKEIKKTKVQLQSLSGRTAPLAGATGATIQQEMTPTAQAETQSTMPATAYSINFVQHEPEPLITPNKPREDHYVHKEKQPPEGFAIKKPSGKRVTFTMAQKEIMVQFYDLQATQGIRANPKDCIEVMRQRGIEPLKESQIRSWWSTYHQKRKNAANALAEEVATSNIPSSRNQQSNTVEQNTQQTEPDQPVIPHSDVRSSPVREGETSTTHVREEACPQQSPEHLPQDLQGSNSLHTPPILERQFSVELSQSTINGRMGSNGCTFIALRFGHLYFANGLQPPIASQLQNNWKVSLIEAILSGNDIHDDIFEGDAVNVAVDDAIEIAGEECFVEKIDHQYDIIGANRVEQLKDVFETLANAKVQSCHVIVTGG